MKHTPQFQFHQRHPLHLLAGTVALVLATPAAQAAIYNWNTGTFTAGVTAPSPLAAADVLNIGAGSFKLFDGGVSNFSNSGTVNWNAEALYLQGGAVVVNNGLWNATSDDNLYYNGGAAPSFTNNGIFRKSGGVGSTTINGTVGFVNNGTLNAQTGSITFTGGSVFNAGSVFSGAGVINAVSGTNTFNGSFTSANLVLSGGTHQGSGATVGGAVAWAGGTLAGTWTIAAGQTVSGVTGGFKYIDGAGTVVTNQGTMAWNTNDLLYMQGGGTLRNQALFVANQNTSVVYNGGAAPTFENTGIVRAAAGITLNLNNTAGFVNNGGTLEALAGGAIRYNSGATFNAGTSFVGAGSNLAAGNNTWNGSFTSANLVLESGVHAGGGAVLNGTARWTGGFVTGTWTVAAGQTLRGQGGGFKQLDGAGTVLTNLGTVVWDTTDLLYLQGGATLNNQALFVANQNTSVVYNGGAAPAFNNAASGTVRAAAGVALTIAQTTGFANNGGVLSALAGGSISYTGGSVFNAGTQFTGAGSNVAAGSNTWNGSFNSANLVLQSGVHTGNGAVLNGTAQFTGGTVNGTWQVGTGQTLALGDGGFKYIDGAATVVTNKGLVAVNTSDYIYLMSGGTLANPGTLNFNGGGGVLYNGGSLPSFVNTGLIVKSGAGTTTIGDNLAFNNLGTIDVQAGTLALPSNFTNNGTLKGVGSYSVNGTLSNAGTVAPGASPGTLSLSGNYAQAAGGSFAVELQSMASHDLFNITGTAALGGTLALKCFGACSLAVGDVVTILDADGDLSGTFASVTLNGFATGAFNVIYDTVADRVQLQVTQAVTAAVPEPGTYALWLAGLAALGYVARRRRG